MITGAIVIVLLISLWCCAGNGEWGSVAVAGVLIFLVLGLASAGRKCDRAFNNVVNEWAERDRRKK